MLGKHIILLYHLFMHAIKGSWAGQAFALATSNDSSGRKSRIRRSKEERKTMVESFINKYQHSNNGNFPSLNLTHKEVGGSFYTVREIVREIIQENRVLAPPKDYSDFIEQNPLGSISMEPQVDSSISESVHMETHFLTPDYQVSSEENISVSTEQFDGPYLSKSDNEQIEGVIKVAEKNEAHDFKGESYQALNNYLIINDEKVVNGIEELEENSHFDNRQDNNDSAILTSQEINGQNNEEFEQKHVTKSTEILDEGKYGARDLEVSETVKSRVSSNVVVETFPLRPVPGTIHMEIESGNLRESDETLEAIRNSSGIDDAKGEEKIVDEKAVLNHQGPSLESSKYSSPSKSIVLESRDLLSFGTKDSLITVGTKASGQDNTSLPKENNPTLDRINLETWEGTSNKSNRHESNPLVAFVRAFISSFVKFWTE
ncbi:hypothetical protein CASFOL_023087 [Castilleja foliolosa]|uniref:AT3G52170-like helix-turn-helix domain-containing protein n=1 Tax=Castilleja foliolosa TaxID=1961234 RepID=A0ABD3CJK5_9LAMI